MKFLISFVFLGLFGVVFSLKCYKCRDEDGPVYIQNSKCANNSNSNVFDCDKQCILEGLVFHYSVDMNDELTSQRVLVHRGCESFFTKDFCNFHNNKTKPPGKLTSKKVFVQKKKCDSELCNQDEFNFNLEELKKDGAYCEEMTNSDDAKTKVPSFRHKRDNQRLHRANRLYRADPPANASNGSNGSDSSSARYQSRSIFSINLLLLVAILQTFIAFFC